MNSCTRQAIDVCAKAAQLIAENVRAYFEAGTIINVDAVLSTLIGECRVALENVVGEPVSYRIGRGAVKVAYPPHEPCTLISLADGNTSIMGMCRGACRASAALASNIILLSSNYSGDVREHGETANWIAAAYPSIHVLPLDIEREYSVTPSCLAAPGIHIPSFTLISLEAYAKGTMVMTPSARPASLHCAASMMCNPITAASNVSVLALSSDGDRAFYLVVKYPPLANEIKYDNKFSTIRIADDMFTISLTGVEHAVSYDITRYHQRLLTAFKANMELMVGSEAEAGTLSYSSYPSISISDEYIVIYFIDALDSLSKVISGEATVEEGHYYINAASIIKSIASSAMISIMAGAFGDVNDLVKMSTGSVVAVASQSWADLTFDSISRAASKILDELITHLDELATSTKSATKSRLYGYLRSASIIYKMVNYIAIVSLVASSVMGVDLATIALKLVDEALSIGEPVGHVPVMIDNWPLVDELAPASQIGALLAGHDSGFVVAAGLPVSVDYLRNNEVPVVESLVVASYIISALYNLARRGGVARGALSLLNFGVRDTSSYSSIGEVYAGGSYVNYFDFTVASDTSSIIEDVKVVIADASLGESRVFSAMVGSKAVSVSGSLHPSLVTCVYGFTGVEEVKSDVKCASL